MMLKGFLGSSILSYDENLYLSGCCIRLDKLDTPQVTDLARLQHSSVADNVGRTESNPIKTGLN